MAPPPTGEEFHCQDRLFHPTLPEWRAALRRMFDIGLVKFIGPEVVHAARCAGAFAVVKGAPIDHLVADWRPMNTEDGSIGGPALPYVAHLGRWLLARGEALRFSSRGRSAFYCQLGVPASRWPLQAVGPRAPLGWLTGGAGNDQPWCWADWG